MASMSFPGASGIPEFYSFDPPHQHHGSTSSVTDDEFELADDSHGSMTSSHFATGASGFTVNPLSVRTPRVSLIGSSASTSSYAPMSASVSSIATSRPSPGGPQSQSGLVIREDDLDSEIDIRTGSAPSKPVVRTEDVWREIVKSSNGRDKALKLIQYSLKLCTLFHSSVSVSTVMRRRRQASKWEGEVMAGVNSTIAGLSLARKCMILFNWLAPLGQITQPQPVDSFSAMQNKFGKQGKGKQQPPMLHKFLHAPPPVLLDLLNGLADDVSTFSKLGIVNKKLGNRAGRLADWCWFSATIVNLVELQVERGILGNMMQEMQSRLYSESMAGPGKKSDGAKQDESELDKLRRQDYWIQISRAKLLMDLVFVSYEVFEFKRAADSVKTVTGLLSAVLSSYKLYDSQQRSLLKA